MTGTAGSAQFEHRSVHDIPGKALGIRSFVLSCCFQLLAPILGVAPRS